MDPRSVAQLSCLGVDEGSLYRTANSKHFEGERWKEWIAQRAFVALYITSHRGHPDAMQYLLEHGNSERQLSMSPAGVLCGWEDRVACLSGPLATVSWTQVMSTTDRGPSGPLVVCRLEAVPLSWPGLENTLSAVGDAAQDTKSQERPRGLPGLSRPSRHTDAPRLCYFCPTSTWISATVPGAQPQAGFGLWPVSFLRGFELVPSGGTHPKPCFHFQPHPQRANCSFSLC